MRLRRRIGIVNHGKDNLGPLRGSGGDEAHIPRAAEIMRPVGRCEPTEFAQGRFCRGEQVRNDFQAAGVAQREILHIFTGNPQGLRTF